MKIGTILCNLFGHKFIGIFEEEDEDGRLGVRRQNIDFCVRCGIPLEEALKK